MAGSAVELATLYQQRWEIELTFDEIETRQLAHSKLLRSRTPKLVRQELWALLLAHYAVRSFMREAADDLDTDADVLSFTRSIQVIRRQVLNQAGFPLGNFSRPPEAPSLRSRNEPSSHDDTAAIQESSNDTESATCSSGGPTTSRSDMTAQSA